MSNQTFAKGVKGFLLYSPFTHKHFFRVYDSEDKSKFKDYRLSAEDIEVEILANDIVMIDGEQARLDWSDRRRHRGLKSSPTMIDGEQARLDWSDRVLGRDQSQ